MSTEINFSNTKDEMMKKSFQLTIACALFGLAGSTAFAETLDEIAGKTHYHGITFALDKNSDVSRVSPMNDYMDFSPDPTDPLSFDASGHPSGSGNSVRRRN